MRFATAAERASLDVRPGKQAVKHEYRDQLSAGRKIRFTGSVDLDHHYRDQEPDANRWDYGVGVQLDDEVAIWIEPHPASGMKDVKTVIKKFEWLQSKLDSDDFGDLKSLTELARKHGERPYRWVYSGACRLRSGSREDRLLAQHGLRLPERKVTIG